MLMNFSGSVSFDKKHGKHEVSMRTAEKSERQLTHAKMSMHRTGGRQNRVNVTLEITVTEKSTITKTMSPDQVNPFLAQYGVAAVDVSLLDGEPSRQITQVLDLPGDMGICVAAAIDRPAQK